MAAKVNRAVAVILGLTAALSACGGSSSDNSVAGVVTTQTSPSTLPPSSSTTQPATTVADTTLASTSTAPSTTLDTTPREFPSELCCSGQAIGAGLYVTPSWFGIPMSMQVGDGWKVLNEREALLFAIVRGQISDLDLPSELIVFLDASAAGSVDTLIDEFGAEPSITAVGEATETNLAGFPGKQQDFVVVANPGNPGNPANDVPPGVRALPVMGQFFTPGFTWTSSTPEASLRSLAVEVGDSLLLVTLEAPSEDFETLAADAEEILRSLALPES